MSFMKSKLNGSFKIIPCLDGSYTLQRAGFPQDTMHSLIGLKQESQQIYLTQSQLEDRITEPNYGPQVIFDIGLGIAGNALSVIEARKKIGIMAAHPLHLISFESDLSGLTHAATHADKFPLLAEYREEVQEIIKYKIWKNIKLSLTWELKTGSFLDNLDSCPEATLIYFDLYSPTTCGELWGIAAMSKLFQKASKGSCLLITYSSSTAVRTALLLAGFRVGRGLGTQLKHETTLATAGIEPLLNPLGQKWVRKFLRSSNRIPKDWGKTEADLIHHVLQLHQFSKGED